MHYKHIYYSLFITLLIIALIMISSCQEASVYPYLNNIPSTVKDKGFPSVAGSKWVYLATLYSGETVFIDTVDVIIEPTFSLKNGDKVIPYKYSYRNYKKFDGNLYSYYVYFTNKNDTIYQYYSDITDTLITNYKTFTNLVFPLNVGKGWRPKLSDLVDKTNIDTAFVESIVNINSLNKYYTNAYRIRKIGKYYSGYDEILIYDPVIGIILQEYYTVLTYTGGIYYSKIVSSLQLIDCVIKE